MKWPVDESFHEKGNKIISILPSQDQKAKIIIRDMVGRHATTLNL